MFETIFEQDSDLPKNLPPLMLVRTINSCEWDFGVEQIQSTGQEFFVVNTINEWSFIVRRAERRLYKETWKNSRLLTSQPCEV